MVPVIGTCSSEGAQSTGLGALADIMASDMEEHSTVRELSIPFGDRLSQNETATLSSALYPLSVRIPPGVPLSDAQFALQRLEQSYLQWKARHWPEPVYGSAEGYVVYLDDNTHACAEFTVEAIEHQKDVDAARGFATVSIPKHREGLIPCIYKAFALGSLYRLAPYMNPKWKDASASYLAWQLSARDDFTSGTLNLQAQPWHGWFGHSFETGNESAHLWALIEKRKKAFLGDYFWDMWDRARFVSINFQHRNKSFDLWEIIEAELKASSQTLPKFLTELALDRATIDRDRHRVGFSTEHDILMPTTELFVQHFLKSGELPTKINDVDPPLEALGSAYFSVNIQQEHRGRAIGVWLKGEHGVNWSLSAARRDATDYEISRIYSPERKNIPIYLLIETTPQTQSLLIAVTNLSWREPNVAYPDSSTRSFSLTVDLAESKTPNP
ncbi:MAG: hypothetical protein IPJ88_05645 [Myxococcales bacterium]|nr:MAG: hypothetical protein IPJ88_05645 [Myxococcales bacterium]